MKSSTISNPFLLAGNALGAALVERIMPAPVYRGTFNSIVNACLLAFSNPALVIVDTRARTVTVAEGTAPLSGGVDGTTFVRVGGTYREVVPSDPNVRSAGIVVKVLNTDTDTTGDTVTSGVTVPGGQSAFDAALDASLGAQDTAKSLGSIADAIADAMEADERDGLIVFDQLAEKCRFYANPIANNREYDVKAILNDVTADSTLAVFNVAVPEVPAPLGFFGV